MTVPGSSLSTDDDEASCLPNTPEEERRIVMELTKVAESNLKEGNLYYVLSSRWFMDWKRYTGLDMDNHPDDQHFFDSQHCNEILLERPGQIDNSHLVLNGNDNDGGDLEIHRTLEEVNDYVLVPEEVWKKLHDWYKGGPALPRKLISQGVHNNFSVEVYPLCLNLIDSRDCRKFVIQISRKASVCELYNRVCALLELDQEKFRIWDYFSKRKHLLLTAFNQTLEECTLLMDQDILLEVQLDGLWPPGFGMDSTGNELALVPVEPSRSSVTHVGGTIVSNDYSTGYGSDFIQGNSSSSPLTDSEDGGDLLSPMRKGDAGGLAGLHNLGNTCFMNSAIQCLVHTPPLVEYFLQDYSEEINELNPLGMHGELAIAFGDLLRKLWSSGRTPIAPRAFKGKLAQFAPQFCGYNQHDSQELLAFLLDGLHEDLNRVKNKPYIETKDANGRPDEEVADEYWENHKARNDSVIVDVCQGQYKSTLVCPICSKVSVTFDPFMYLSLPLPSMVTRTMTITVFHGDGSAIPMPYTVTLLKHGCCKDLIQTLSTACCLRDDESMLLAEVYDYRIYRYLENPFEPLSMIKDDEYIVGYRLPKNHEGLTRLEIIHRDRSKGKYTSDILCSLDRALFGTPLVTCLARAPQTGADIQSMVHMLLEPFLRRNTNLPLNEVHTSEQNSPASGVIIDRPLNCFDSKPGPMDQSTDDMVCVQEQNDLASGVNCFDSKPGPMNQSTDDMACFQEQNDPASGVNCFNSKPGPMNQSTDDMELEEMCNVELSFQLSLTDEKVLTCYTVENDSLIRPGRFIHILLDWSDREHDLYDISYLENLPEVLKTEFTVKKAEQEEISLFSCLEAFLKEEPLGPDDMWYCPTCKEHRQATKKLDLWTLPEILVVHLKRFSYNRFQKIKLDTFVKFPIHNLNLNDYVKPNGDAVQPNVYELYAVSNHYGGLGGGHYSAYAKLLEGDRWYHFDDNHVYPVSEDEIKTAAAYVLFYQRVKLEPEKVLEEQSQVHSPS